MPQRQRKGKNEDSLTVRLVDELMRQGLDAEDQVR